MDKEKTRQQTRRKIVLYAAVVAIAAIAATAALQKYQDDAFSSLFFPDTEEVRAEDNGHLFYQNEEYVPREGIQTYLFIGIDEPGKVQADKQYSGGGQADVQLLLVLDEQANTWRLLNINRDLLTDIPVLNMFGNVAGYEKGQIALAHAYGNGLESSNENATLAVSEVLHNQPIDGTISLNMDAIGVVNQRLGGLTVKVADDLSKIDPKLKKGKTVTLSDEQAIQYVRARKDVGDETNETRMARHESIVEAMLQKLPELSDEDVIRLYDALHEYMVSDIGSKTMVEITDALRSGKQLSTLYIDGKQIEWGENFAWQADEEALKQIVIELFYQKAD